MQSIVDEKAAAFHVAIIMDGNGRWATRRGLPRSAGHQAGVRAARLVTQAAPDLGVTTLSLFAFSSDNWRRPRAEVNALMSLLRHYLACELRDLVENGIRLTVIGRRDRLPAGLGPRSRTQSRTRQRAHGSICGSRSTIRLATPSSIRRFVRAPARRRHATPLAGCSPPEEPVPTSIFSSAPAARSGCRIFCCGNAPTPSFASSTPCRPTSTPTIWPRPLLTSGAANDASADCRALRRSRRPNDFRPTSNCIEVCHDRAVIRAVPGDHGIEDSFSLPKFS